MNSERNAVRLFTATMVIVAVVFACTPLTRTFCSLPMVQMELSSGKALNCFEFWTNRYQSGLGAAIALVAAILAWQAVHRQTRIGSLSALREQLVDLKELRSAGNQAITRITQCLSDIERVAAFSDPVAEDLIYKTGYELGGMKSDITGFVRKFEDCAEKEVNGSSIRAAAIIAVSDLKASMDFLQYFWSSCPLHVDRAARYLFQQQARDSLVETSNLIDQCAKRAEALNTLLDPVITGISREVSNILSSVTKAPRL